MKPEQIANRLFNSVRKDVVRQEITTQLAIYQALIDELEREMGRIEDETSSEDERFAHSDNEDDEDEDGGV